VLLNNVDNQEIACNNFTINGGTSGSTVLNIKSDTDNAGGAPGEADHPSIILHQDGANVKGKLAMGDNDLTLQNTYAGLKFKTGRGSSSSNPYADFKFIQGSTTIVSITNTGIVCEEIFKTGALNAADGVFAQLADITQRLEALE
jgi:hypothetical protein